MIKETDLHVYLWNVTKHFICKCYLKINSIYYDKGDRLTCLFVKRDQACQLSIYYVSPPTIIYLHYEFTINYSSVEIKLERTI